MEQDLLQIQLVGRVMVPGPLAKIAPAHDSTAHIRLKFVARKFFQNQPKAWVRYEWGKLKKMDTNV
jgi:hypothetical protein